MKRIRVILGGLWKIYVILCFIVFLFLFYPIYFVFLRKEKHFRKGFRLLFYHTKILMVLTGIKVQLKNIEFIASNQPYVIVSNHTSYLDIIILYQTFKNYFVFMGKEELSKVPIFNIFFKKMNITVNRKSNSSAKRAVERCASELKKGNSIVIFPEGTISTKAPVMLPFKNGAFKLAIDYQIPIIPITFLDNYKRLEMAGIFSGKAGPGVARTIIHTPISTVGLTENDLVPLRDKVFEIINQSLLDNEHR